MTLRTTVASLSLLVAAALLHAGCGGAPSSEDICDKACSCAGSECTDDAKKQCIADIDDARNAADKAGCGSEADDLLSCLDDQSCSMLEKQGEDACKTQQEAVEKCGGRSDVTSGSDSG